MAVRKNPDGSVSVGILSKPTKVAPAKPVAEPKPKRPTKSK